MGEIYPLLNQVMREVIIFNCIYHINLKFNMPEVGEATRMPVQRRSSIGLDLLKSSQNNPENLFEKNPEFI